ncbi:tryptophan 7-halogenase [Saccharobesus litoralis]|uniref:Tryptophan 7-halogenase n=1 Tax=Saccharobesus litoralis TaxID=2172099 RepID=A0A2S0VV16_9ALTE|nr:tryptophan halogenase family protein [Saccharobesus litoralis]AWB68061.1 tryptophan 7-halogenase [Saccharobesus litoralis]
MRSILICGGGTAGWMTAVYLSHLYNRFEQTVSIELIESSDLPPVGVGEATVHSIRHFFDMVGINEAEFFTATDATFKLGIEFINWKQAQKGKTHSYWHPFDMQTAEIAGDNLAQCWLDNLAHTKHDYAHSVSISPYLSAAHKAPKTIDMPAYQAPIPYAYHFDAGKLATFLKSIALKRGVKHTIGAIDKVIQHNGIIQAIQTNIANKQADFYFDCTGFRGLLINQLSANNWLSLEDELPCNRALAIQTPYPDQQQPATHTQAIAMQHGWRWRIGLQNRVGNGYVFSDKYCSESQAEQELRQDLLQNNTKLGRDAEFKLLKMRIGHRQQTWINNCCAIGLSSGFIEPLESTGIYLIEAGLRLWGEYTRFHDFSQLSKATSLLPNQYNQILRDIYQDLKRFIVLHYVLSDRQDSEFWRSWQQVLNQDEVLQQQLAVWRYKPVEASDFFAAKSQLFNEINYRFVLYGMGHLPTQTVTQTTKQSASQVPATRGSSHQQNQLNLLKQLNQFCLKQTQKHPDQMAVLNSFKSIKS